MNMSAFSKTLHGHYLPTNPGKVLTKGGELPAFKSKLEWKMMRYCDLNPAILKWCYEPPFAIVPYFDKGAKKNRHYYVDFVLWVKDDTKPDKMRQVWVEIKPFEQTQPPKVKPKSRVTESQVFNIKTYITNQCKWAAARKYCEARGFDFIVVTEKELG